MKKSLKPLPPQTLTPSILVSGSLVYDTIFDLRGKMREQIVLKDGKLGNQNLMFTGKEKQIYFGGTAGNIAYGLGKLGLSPFVVSVVGRDFGFYEEHINNLGAKLRLKRDQDGYCATFYAMTDENNEQIGIYQGGCCDKYLVPLSLKDCMSVKEIEKVKVSIFSAGVAESIVRQMEEFKKINTSGTVIFDPGQILAISFTLPLLKRALKAADIGIFNETEFNLLKTKFGLDLKDLFSLGLKFCIETKGADGSKLIQSVDQKIVTIEIPSIRVNKVVDPTGAGDAYRAGLISGLVSGKTLVESMKIGARFGAQCVQKLGGQTY